MKGTDYWTAVDKQEIISALYPVGSFYTTGTNKNPSAFLGGTWELAGKSFAEKSGSSTSAYHTVISGVKSLTVTYRRVAQTIWLKFVLNNSVALSETDTGLFTLNLEALGITSLAYSSITSITFGSDGGGGVIICEFTSGGKFTVYDVLLNSDAESAKAGSNWYGYLTLPIPHEYMIDSFCDKFYWKRTG